MIPQRRRHRIAFMSRQIDLASQRHEGYFIESRGEMNRFGVKPIDASRRLAPPKRTHCGARVSPCVEVKRSQQSALPRFQTRVIDINGFPAASNVTAAGKVRDQIA